MTVLLTFVALMCFVCARPCAVSRAVFMLWRMVQMERRERLRKLCAQLADEDVLAAMDALEPEGGDKQFVPSTVFYTNGQPALVEARLEVHTLKRYTPWSDAHLGVLCIRKGCPR